MRSRRAGDLPEGSYDSGDFGEIDLILDLGEVCPIISIQQIGDSTVITYSHEDSGPYTTTFDRDETVAIQGDKE